MSLSYLPGQMFSQERAGTNTNIVGVCLASVTDDPAANANVLTLGDLGVAKDYHCYDYKQRFTKYYDFRQLSAANNYKW